MAVDIIQVKTEQENLVLNAWNMAYPDMIQYKYPQRWQWLFKKSPFIPEFITNLNKIPIWAAFENGRVMAWNCAMWLKIEIQGKTYPGAFSIDTFTLPEFRSRKLNYLIQEQHQEQQKIFMTIDVSDANRHIKYKLGGKPGKPLHIYFKNISGLDHDSLFESAIRVFKKSNKKKTVFLANCIKRFGFKTVLGLFFEQMIERRLVTNSDKDDIQDNEFFQFQSIQSFGEEFDVLWSKIKGSYSFSVRRDSQYLNWKYRDQPHVEFKKFRIVKENKISGLLVIRNAKPPELPTGFICEILSVNNNPAFLKSILCFAEAELIRGGAQFIRCGSSTSLLNQILQDSGYFKIKINVPVVYVDKDIASRINFNRLTNGEWLMSLGDQDMDQILGHDQPSFLDLLKLIKGIVPGQEHLKFSP